MLRATEVIARGDWEGDAADSAVLSFEERQRQGSKLASVGGTEFQLALPEAVALRSGDAVKLEDGRLIEIVGAPEALAEIRAANPEHMLRLAWHLGEGHAPIQIVNGRLRIRSNPALEAMIEAQGGRIRVIEAAFDPEGGAYVTARHTHHDHTRHDHAHHHGSHNHSHHHHGHHDHDGHAHKGHAHAAHDHHAHGPGCGCGHDHKHKHG